MSQFVQAFSTGCRLYRGAVITTVVLAATLAMPSFASAEEVEVVLTSHGGPVETEPHVYEIYWGKKWSEAPAAGERSTFESLYNDFSGSAWQGILTQYWGAEGSGGAEGFVSKELVVGAPYTDNSEPPAEVEVASMEAEVKEAIKEASSKKLAGWPTSVSATTMNDQFVLLTPPGTMSKINKEACGEHGAAKEANYAYDFIPWEDEPKGIREECKHTFIASHEYAEAATDPRLNAWKNWRAEEKKVHKEIADLCQVGYSSGTLDGIEVTKLWDDRKEREEKASEKCSESDPEPPKKSPEYKTEGTSSVTSSAATLEGKATPNGLEIQSYAFEWRMSESEKYKQVPERGFEESWSGNQKSKKVSVLLSGLTPSTTYHYRLVIYDVATLSEIFTQSGETKEFKTLTVPSVTTGTASKVTQMGATLSGTVNPNGVETKYYFEYGPTTAYGSKTAAVSAGSGTSNLEESKVASPLLAGLEYHFRMVATGGGETIPGKDATFKIPVEWRQAGAVLSGSVAMKSKGTVKLTDEAAGGGEISVECEAAGEGSVGSGAVDEETKSTASKCAFVSALYGACEATHAVALEAVHLPWHSELLVSEGAMHDAITNGGKGAPGYKIKCTVGGVEKVVDECTGTTLKTSIANAAGGASAIFDGEKLNCTLGGTGKGLLEGGRLVEATKGGLLEVFPAPEWHQAGAALSESVAMKSKGTVKLTDEAAGGGEISVECEAAGEGSVGSGAVGEETKSTLSKCAFVSTMNGACEATHGVALEAVHLPWHSELLVSVSEGTAYDVITNGGKGIPGFKIKCTVGGIEKVEDECTGTTLKTSIENAAGGVEETFDGEKLNCTSGGTGKGLLEGSRLVEATKGGLLEAFPAPEWRQAGAALSGSVAAKSKVAAKLIDEAATGGRISVECEATGEGSVGAGVVGEETKWTTSKCAFVSSEHGACEASKAVALEAMNLPWHSELVVSAGTTYDAITTGGKGSLGYKIKCTVGGITKVVDECTGTTLKTGIENATGGVEAPPAAEKLNCTLGGTGKGLLEGTQLVEATIGGALEVT